MTREEWLLRAIQMLREDFKAIDVPFPDVIHVRCDLYRQGRRILGECCFNVDGTIEIKLASFLRTSREVLTVLTHELVHASVGYEVNHEGPFRIVASSIGLLPCFPDWTETTDSQALTVRFQEISKKLGNYPC